MPFAATLTGRVVERIPLRWNRNSLYFSLSDRIFCGEPVSTSPENALAEDQRITCELVGNWALVGAGAVAFLTVPGPDLGSTTTRVPTCTRW
jgi:hypothetical protein